jgi:hypothetical protein
MCLVVFWFCQDGVVAHLESVSSGDERLVHFSKHWATHRLFTEYVEVGGAAIMSSF